MVLANCDREGQRMTVMIGVDPHKRSHTAVAIGDDESELTSIKVRSTRRQVPQLLRGGFRGDVALRLGQQLVPDHELAYGG